MRSLIIIALLVVFGCSSSRTNFDESAPYPVKMALFPLIADAPDEDIILSVLFYLDKQGEVLDVALASEGITPEWNAAAIDSMRKWTFSKPPQNLVDEGIWVRRSVRVFFDDPVIMNLASITIPEAAMADSVYAALTYRSKLDELFTDSSKHNFPYTLEVQYDQNLGVYPDHIRNELKKLRLNTYTKPLKLDNYYVIYQRIDTLKSTIQ